MLRRGCRAAKAWPADISMSINLTTEEVCDPATPLRILGAAMECDFPPTPAGGRDHRKSAGEGLCRAKQVVAALRGAGVKILLDDFGAGYSGLGYLRELAFDCIKIDRTFISTLPTQIESRKIIKAIQGLAGSLDLTTVAEGIENKQILDAVQRCRLHLRPGLLLRESNAGRRRRGISERPAERIAAGGVAASSTACYPPRCDRGRTVLPREVGASRVPGGRSTLRIPERCRSAARRATQAVFRPRRTGGERPETRIPGRSCARHGSSAHPCRCTRRSAKWRKPRSGTRSSCGSRHNGKVPS